MPCIAHAAAAAKSLQSCPTLCDPRDGSPPSSPILGILQAIILEWVAISFSNAWKWKVKVKSFSHVRLLATSRTAAYQAPPSMGFSRQEYWTGVPLPSPYARLYLRPQISGSQVHPSSFWFILLCFTDPLIYPSSTSLSIILKVYQTFCIFNLFSESSFCFR